MMDQGNRRAALAAAFVLGGLLGFHAGPASAAPVQRIVPLSGPNPHLAGGNVSVVDSTVSMDLPVDVVLVGYPRETAQALADALVPRPIEQAPYTHPRTISPPFAPGRFVTNVHFRVHHAPQALADGYRQALQAAPGGAGHDANAAEAWLTTALAGARFRPNPARPALVLLHLGTTGHGYAYDYGNGSLTALRAFGSGAMLFMDLSAAPDPFDGALDSYHVPIGNQGAEALAALEAVVVDAANFRLAQGPIFLPAMASCHAVTVVLARRMTALSDNLTGNKGLPLDTQRIAAAYAKVLGDPVFVDVRELVLPAADPALEVMTRTLSARDPLLGVGPDQVAREWFELNWDNYHVDRPGCEEYLSVMVYGDLGDLSGLSMAQYDHAGHRFSFSIARELCRGPAGEMGIGVNVAGVIGAGCAARAPDNPYNVPSFITIHEVGHLLGLRHPHDIDVNGAYVANWAFSSPLSAMSYQPGDRVMDFGGIDAANLQRNRAATALWLAQRQWRHRSPEFYRAVRAMAGYRWNDVVRLLRQ